MEQESSLDIQELIVVEGKNDAHAVRRALGKVDVIWTEGFGLTEEKLKVIAEMARRQGVIVCTDPDFAGGQIRERISRRVPDVRHVFLSRECAISKKGDDIGLENASSENIRKAFAKVLQDKSPREGNPEAGNPEKSETQGESPLTIGDLVEYGLVGQEGSAEKRAALGKTLGIGDTNAKQFLYRVNRYAISKTDFLNALEGLNQKG